MFLVTDNNQGELSPLEIGLHAANAIEKGANRHTGAGLGEYAAAIGKSQAYISQARSAAMVVLDLSQLKSTPELDLSRLMNKAQHLNEIHKAPASLWPILVSALLAKEWSVKDTKHFVGKVLEFEVPDIILRHFRTSMENGANDGLLVIEPNIPPPLLGQVVASGKVCFFSSRPAHTDGGNGKAGKP